MITTKVFQDGNRLVVVFEGLNNVPSSEEMVRSYLSVLLKAGSEPVEEAVEMLSPAEVEPIISEDDVPPEITEEIFLTGPYEGKTPKEILENGSGLEKRKAFIYLTQFIKKDVTEEEQALKEEAEAVVAQYLSNFKGSGKEYAAKLNPKQVDLFLGQFLGAVTDDVKQGILTSCNAIGISPKTAEEVKRKVVAEYVDYFVKTYN